MQVLRELHASCQTEDGHDDLKKGTQLLEIYALEIQMHTEQKNSKKLKELYHVGGAASRACSPRTALPACLLTPWATLLCRAEGAGYSQRHPPPSHHGCHPRVRRQDAHAGAGVG